MSHILLVSLQEGNLPDKSSAAIDSDLQDVEFAPSTWSNALEYERLCYLPYHIDSFKIFSICI